jgi:hypothetical protein
MDPGECTRPGLGKQDVFKKERDKRQGKAQEWFWTFPTRIFLTEE